TTTRSPIGVIEFVAPSKLAPMTRKHVASPGRFFRGGHLPAEAGHLIAEVVPGRQAAGRDGALHGPRVPQREPFAIERARDAAFVAGAAKRLPSLVEGIGAPGQPCERLLVLA